MIKYNNHDIVFQEFPDEVTLAINLSLCPNGCPGCHSAYLQGDIGEELTPERLLGIIEDFIGEITCVGFMGGDNDPAEIVHLVHVVKDRYGDRLHTGWYSGRQQLPAGFTPDGFDYVKVGPYVKALGPLNSTTTNQRLYRIENGEFVDITSRFWKKGF